MSQVNIFKTIKVTVPKGKIYSRLGLALGITKIDPKQQTEVDRYIDEAMSLITLTGSAMQVPIQDNKNGRVLLYTGITFESKDLSEFLQGCQEAILMGVSAGKNISEAIAHDAYSKNLSRSVVLDAAASEIADAGLGWIMNYYAVQLRRDGKVLLPRRFSAGYGDFHLENQRLMYFALLLGRLGIEITNAHMLLPEKSVTAVTGVKSVGIK